MDWLNLHTSILDSPEVIGADPTERATWLMLLRYCIGQENTGIIRESISWKDRKWQQVVRITLAEVTTHSELWTWNGHDLHVKHYPADKEAEVKHLRSIGQLTTPQKKNAARNNGKLGGRPPKTQQETQRKTQQRNPTETQQEPNKKPIQGKGREGKGKEGEAEEAAASAASLAVKLISAHPRPSHNRAALEAAHAALRLDPFDVILEGVQAYARAVDAWPTDEQIAYTMTAGKFFDGMHWRTDPAEWLSRRAAKKNLNGTRPELGLGRRKPAGVLDTSAQLDLNDSPEPNFDQPQTANMQ